MAKIYCKECKHIAIYKEVVYMDYVYTYRCDNDVCFQGGIEEVDTPLARKKIDRTRRILDKDMLNANNGCTHFEKKKRWIDFFKGEKPDNSRSVESVEIDTSLNDSVLEIAVLYDRIKKLQKAISDKDETISSQAQIIERQNNVMFTSTKGKTVFDNIDLD
jgi:hypothetical protein